MTVVKVKLCESCEAKLAAWRRNVGERAMAGMAGQILQACPSCASQLPQTDGHLFTKLPRDFEPDFEPQKGTER
jgi:hypothetical protein